MITGQRRWTRARHTEGPPRALPPSVFPQLQAATALRTSPPLHPTEAKVTAEMAPGQNNAQLHSRASLDTGMSGPEGEEDRTLGTGCGHTAPAAAGDAPPIPDAPRQVFWLLAYE